MKLLEIKWLTVFDEYTCYFRTEAWSVSSNFLAYISVMNLLWLWAWLYDLVSYLTSCF